MGRLCGILSLLVGTSAWGGTLPITDTERQWLSAAMPVMAYARSQALPVDIVIQPQDGPGASPVALGLQDGRCKLVFTMRGNPGLDRLAASIPEGLFTAVAEAVIAHELAHCWRKVHGAWASLPSGVETREPGESDLQLARLHREMTATRREEGFADLFGLAWTLQQRPGDYASVQAWLLAARDDVAVEGEHHDTRLWVRLAARPAVFPGDLSLFEQAAVAWAEGLRREP